METLKFTTIPQEKETDTFKVKAYGASGSGTEGKSLTLMEIERRKPKRDEILIEVLYCGVCHSDVQQVENVWKNTIYPCVPGREIIGKVIDFGSHVTDFELGEVVGVGCMINSCKHCKFCKKGEEQFCLSPVGMTMTYNGYWNPDGSGVNTFGGFSSHIVANQSFVLRIPPKLKLSVAAPILCAGVAAYSPLKHWNIKRGDKVGIIGIGSLGHLAVMIAKAMGAKVTAITTKEEKKKAALDLGADTVLVENEEEMREYALYFDFLLCTIPEEFDVNPYIRLLHPRGSIVTIGLLGSYKRPIDNMEVARYARNISASLMGSIAETQEVLEFCAEHHILPQVETIRMEDINGAFEKIKKDEARFGYVIDMKSLK